MSRSLLLKELDKFSFPKECFIETGTYTGGGVQVAVLAGFRSIYSVELDETFWRASSRSFASNKNVKILLGSSPEFLSELLPKIDKVSVIFLDAHNKDYNPIFDELKAIKDHSLVDHIILVDDLRQYDGTYWDTKVDDIIDAVLDVNKDYKISYMDSVNAKRDILVARIDEI
jgi:precorrin-6B methylase 2